MIEEIPDWIAALSALILGPTALYLCYILPGYKQDQIERLNND